MRSRRGGIRDRKKTILKVEVECESINQSKRIKACLSELLIDMRIKTKCIKWEQKVIKRDSNKNKNNT